MDSHIKFTVLHGIKRLLSVSRISEPIDPIKIFSVGSNPVADPIIPDHAPANWNKMPNFSTGQSLRPSDTLLPFLLFPSSAFGEAKAGIEALDMFKA